MSHLHWTIKSFHQFTLDELYDVLRLRVDVFVVEQQCAYAELDGQDRHVETRHLLGYDVGGQLVAYARLLPPGLTYPEAGIGRLVVKAGARGHGIGRELFEKALDACRRYWPDRGMRLSAQTYLQGFYERRGLIPIADPYLEDGIPHVDMVLALNFR